MQQANLLSHNGNLMKNAISCEQFFLGFINEGKVIAIELIKQNFPDGDEKFQIQKKENRNKLTVNECEIFRKREIKNCIR